MHTIKNLLLIKSNVPQANIANVTQSEASCCYFVFRAPIQSKSAPDSALPRAARDENERKPFFYQPGMLSAEGSAAKISNCCFSMEASTGGSELNKREIHIIALPPRSSQIPSGVFKHKTYTPSLTAAHAVTWKKAF